MMHRAQEIGINDILHHPIIVMYGLFLSLKFCRRSVRLTYEDLINDSYICTHFTQNK